MKFRQLSFKSFQKSRSKKKTKDNLPVVQQVTVPVIDVYDNAITDDSKNFDNVQNVSLRCSLRRYKTSVTPCNKHVIKNRRTAISDDEDENGLQYELDDIDKVLSSVRKERTRIKTNPWIPPRKSLHENDLIKLVEEGTSPEDFLNVCILAKEGGKTYISSESSQIPDNATVTRRMKQELSLSELNVNRWSIISEGDVSIDLNSPTIEELNEKFANIDYAIDFKYEENIDNVLDDEITTKQAKRLSINDLLEDYSEESSDTSNSSMEISDSTSCTGSDSSEGSSENQLPSEIAVFSIHKNRMEESIDAGYSSLSRDSRFPSTSDSDSAGHSESDSEEEGNTTIVVDDYDNLGACAACNSERSLPDIRCSLQEKVNQLRAEKIIVEEKIREAQEDDKIRLKETQRFRRHLPVYKKQVLIKTLNSLKERLENQSQRLQKSYSTVLAMQRRFAQRHNPFFMVPKSNFR